MCDLSLSPVTAVFWIYACQSRLDGVFMSYGGTYQASHVLTTQAFHYDWDTRFALRKGSIYLIRHCFSVLIARISFS